MTGNGSYPYDISVIVPVYNAAEHLSRCVASLDAQAMPQDRFEVVLVNDGSTDSSLEVCQDIALQRPNYVVIDQENQGVSVARNRGISAAHGRYLMFLDPDDELTDPSIEALVDAFEHMGSQVDLLTYPLSYHEASSGYVHQHKRQTWLTKTGVYDLNEFPFIVQTTVNVCVRNQGEETPRFDESLRLCEDQRFNTDILAAKAAIGYCAEATYVYWRYDGTSAATRHLSRDTFDGIVRNYEHFIDLAEAHDAFARYAYALVIYDTSWRIRQHELLPHNVDDETRILCQQRMDDVLARIPRDSWLESPYLSDTLRIYQLRRCGRLGEVEGTSYDAKGASLHLKGGEDLHVDSPSVVIDWLLRKPDCVTMKGYVYGPSLAFEDKPFLSVTVDGKTSAADLRPSRCDDEHTGVSLTKAWRFETPLPPMEKTYDVGFALRLGGNEVPAIKLVFDLQRCNGRFIGAKKREFRDRRASIEGQILHVGTIKDLPRGLMPLVMKYLHLRNRVPKGWCDVGLIKALRRELPSVTRRLKGKTIWLYIDAMDECDATLALQAITRDLVDASDGIERVYARMRGGECQESPDAEGVPTILNNHDCLINLLRAERIITSSDSLKSILPYGKAVWDRVADFTVAQIYELVADSYQHLGDSIIDVVIPIKEITNE